MHQLGRDVRGERRATNRAVQIELNRRGRVRPISATQVPSRDLRLADQPKLKFSSYSQSLGSPSRTPHTARPFHLNFPPSEFYLWSRPSRKYQQSSHSFSHLVSDVEAASRMIELEPIRAIEVSTDVGVKVNQSSAFHPRLATRIPAPFKSYNSEGPRSST